MRIKHLEKVGEVEKALILTKACGNCSLLPNQATFLQTYVTQLCQQLPSEEAIVEVINSGFLYTGLALSTKLCDCGLNTFLYMSTNSSSVEKTWVTYKGVVRSWIQM